MADHYMEMRPEDLNSEELRYELEIRKHASRGLTTRQMCIALNQHILDEKTSPELYHTLRSCMMFNQEKEIIQQSCAEILAKFKILVTIEALQILISRTIHYSRRVPRMNAHSVTHAEFVDRYTTQLQLLLDRMIGSIDIDLSRPVPRLYLNLAGIDIHDYLVDPNCTLSSNDPPNASNINMNNATNEENGASNQLNWDCWPNTQENNQQSVIASNSIVSSAQQIVSNSQSEAQAIANITSTKVPPINNQDLIPSQNSLTTSNSLPILTVASSRYQPIISGESENHHFTPTLSSSLSHSNPQRSLTLGLSFATELSEMENEQRQLKQTVEKSANDVANLSRQVNDINEKLSQMHLMIRDIMAPRSFSELRAARNSLENIITNRLSVANATTTTDSNNAPISSTQFVPTAVAFNSSSQANQISGFQNPETVATAAEMIDE